MEHGIEVSDLHSAQTARFSRVLADDAVFFFDGVCGLCDGTVSFVMKVDKKKTLRFSPLQSEYARKELPPVWTADLQSMVLKDGGQVYTQSDAVLRVLEYLGGFWWILGRTLRLVPKKLRDPIYSLIAKYRYKIFGVKSECRIPSPQERSRFIL